MKLAFHAVVANYCGNLVVNSFIFYATTCLAIGSMYTKGNSNKNSKKKEHNVNKREVLQAHAIQVQTLQNELESLRAQLANLKGKSS